MYRLVECKHIHVVKFWLALRNQIVSEVEETIPEIVCPLCGSEEIKKNGSRMTKMGKRQRYRCLQYDKSFMLDEAFKEFYSRYKKDRVEHIRKPRFTDPTNNRVERLNGTVRERETVMRGMKGDNTAEELMNGFRTYYNFMRPHQSLGGRTPAEASGLDLELGENKWVSLINQASQSS